jgi:hypothetical protein
MARQEECFTISTSADFIIGEPVFPTPMSVLQTPENETNGAQKKKVSLTREFKFSSRPRRSRLGKCVMATQSKTHFVDLVTTIQILELFAMLTLGKVYELSVLSNEKYFGIKCCKRLVDGKCM